MTTKKPTEATCDYCKKRLNCPPDSIMDRYYWTINAVLRACDECLLKNSDDFQNLQPDKRIAALRLLYSDHTPHYAVTAHVMLDRKPIEVGAHPGINLERVNKIIEGAEKGKIDGRYVQQAKYELALFFELFGSGERVAALQTGKLLGRTAGLLEAMLNLKDDVTTGRRAARQRRKAGFSSAKEREAERKPTWDDWQKQADELRSKNPRLTKTAIAQRIAEKSNVSARAVSGRITIPKKVGK